MSIFIKNFGRRVADWLSQNRARLTKWLIIAGALVLVYGLICLGVERLARARYEKRVQALDRQFRDADQKAKDAEARADIINRTIEAKQTELQFVQARADAAEKTLRETRTVIIPLKKHYEDIRNTPMPVTPVSCADACAELAAIGFPCR